MSGLIDKFITKTIPTIPNAIIPQTLYIVESEYEVVNFTFCNTSDVNVNSITIAINVRGDTDINLTKPTKNFLLHNLELSPLEVLTIKKIILIPGFDVWGNSESSSDVSLIISGIKLL